MIILIIAQLVLGFSVAYVWILRYHNVVSDFQLFGLSDTTRNAVGVAKIATATLLIAGIWFKELVFIPAVIMSLFMIAAQYFHFKVKNPFIKHVPSLVLLVLAAFIAIGSLQIH